MTAATGAGRGALNGGLPRWAGPSWVGLARATLIDAAAVVRTAARLILRHWPVLVALCLAGLTGRELAMRAAVWTSDINGVLGFLVLVFAPLSSLTAMVLMLRALRSSLPWLRMAVAVSNDETVILGSRPRTLLNYLGSALVPFLAVYASYGYLKDDVSEYAYRVWQAAALGDAEIFNGKKIDVLARLPFTLGTVLIAVVVVAIGLRWLLSRWAEKPRLTWLGILGAYVEVLWITIVAWVLTEVQGGATDWVEGRRAVAWIQDGWSRLLDAVGPLAGTLRNVASWAGGLLGSIDVVIVVPIAWLAVGAVVFGHKVAPPPPKGELVREAVRRWLVVPRPVRRLGTELSADARERFGPLIQGLRLIIRAGLAPMTLFCLAFLLAQTASKWLWEVERMLIGPQDINTVWRAVDEPLGVVNDTIATVLLVCLLGAAVDRVLRTVPPAPASPPQPRVPAAPVPPPAASDRSSGAPQTAQWQPAMPTSPGVPVQPGVPFPAGVQARPAEHFQPPVDGEASTVVIPRITG